MHADRARRELAVRGRRTARRTLEAALAGLAARGVAVEARSALVPHAGLSGRDRDPTTSTAPPCSAPRSRPAACSACCTRSRPSSAAGAASGGGRGSATSTSSPSVTTCSPTRRRFRPGSPATGDARLEAPPELILPHPRLQERGFVLRAPRRYRPGLAASAARRDGVADARGAAARRARRRRAPVRKTRHQRGANQIDALARLGLGLGGGRWRAPTAPHARISRRRAHEPPCLCRPSPSGVEPGVGPAPPCPIGQCLGGRGGRRAPPSSRPETPPVLREQGRPRPAFGPEARACGRRRQSAAASPVAFRRAARRSRDRCCGASRGLAERTGRPHRFSPDVQDHVHGLCMRCACVVRRENLATAGRCTAPHAARGNPPSPPTAAAAGWRSRPAPRSAAARRTGWPRPPRSPRYAPPRARPRCGRPA